MYSIDSVKEIQDLNPFIVVGCGGGGEKFANLEGVEAVGFIDDDERKQGKQYCGQIISNSLEKCLMETDAKSIVIMLPIGAEGTALKYAVQAIDAGLNVITSFRSLSVEENPALVKFAELPLKNHVKFYQKFLILQKLLLFSLEELLKNVVKGQLLKN